RLVVMLRETPRGREERAARGRVERIRKRVERARKELEELERRASSISDRLHQYIISPIASTNQPYIFLDPLDEYELQAEKGSRQSIGLSEYLRNTSAS